MRPTLDEGVEPDYPPDSVAMSNPDVPADGTITRFPPIEPDEATYRPDIGLRNGILISVALWIVLITAFIIGFD